MPYRCPLCGTTSNRKNRPFDTLAAVVGHIDAKRDDAHAGHRGGDYLDEIAPVLDSDETSYQDSGASVNKSNTKRGTVGRGPFGQNGGSKNLLTGSDQAIDAAQAPSEPTCPGCGGNKYFDASEHTDYDYGCPECSSKEQWVVWNE